MCHCCVIIEIYVYFMLFYVLCRNFLIGRKIKQSQPLIKHPRARTLVVAIECENLTSVDGFLLYGKFCILWSVYASVPPWPCVTMTPGANNAVQCGAEWDPATCGSNGSLRCRDTGKTYKESHFSVNMREIDGINARRMLFQDFKHHLNRNK